jgi:hypothetical protein
MAQAIAVNESLKFLDLQHNASCSLGVGATVDALRVNRHLQVLHRYSNWTGSRALGHVLTQVRPFVSVRYSVFTTLVRTQRSLGCFWMALA